MNTMDIKKLEDSVDEIIAMVVGGDFGDSDTNKMLAAIDLMAEVIANN